MVNHATNINNTNSHLSPKDSLNSNGQPCHQYQQNSHLSPQIIKHKKIMAYGIGNPGPDLEQAQKCGGVKLVNGIVNHPPLIIGL